MLCPQSHAICQSNTTTAAPVMQSRFPNVPEKYLCKYGFDAIYMSLLLTHLGFGNQSSRVIFQSKVALHHGLSCACPAQILNAGSRLQRPWGVTANHNCRVHPL